MVVACASRIWQPRHLFYARRHGASITSTTGLASSNDGLRLLRFWAYYVVQFKLSSLRALTNLLHGRSSRVAAVVSSLYSTHQTFRVCVDASKPTCLSLVIRSLRLLRNVSIVPANFTGYCSVHCSVIMDALALKVDAIGSLLPSTVVLL